MEGIGLSWRAMETALKLIAFMLSFVGAAWLVSKGIDGLVEKK